MPEEYYQSAYTGTQIDSGIGRILNGELDKLAKDAEASAESAAESADTAKGFAEDAEASAERAETATTKSPIIQDGNWWVWDAATEQYVDSGNSAKGEKGDPGGVPEDLENRLEELEKQMADLLYTPISIISFDHNNGVKEMGDTATRVILSWELNKEPVSLTLDGQDPGSFENSVVMENSVMLAGLSITKDSNKTWTLEVTDERGAAATKSTSISFQNGIYYGAAAVPEVIDSAFVMSLAQKVLGGSKNRTVTISGGNSLYAWYAYPKRLGASLFNIGGLDYDYYYSVVPFTNQFGFTEDYYVYRSGQYVPESISVTVKNGG